MADMATQSVIHPVPQQKSAVVSINSSVQETPVAEPLIMTIRAANNRTPGARTFCVAQHVVQLIRRAGQRRWFCDCGDFKFATIKYRWRMVYVRRILSHAEYDEKEWQKS